MDPHCRRIKIKLLKHIAMSLGVNGGLTGTDLDRLTCFSITSNDKFAFVASYLRRVPKTVAQTFLQENVARASRRVVIELKAFAVSLGLNVPFVVLNVSTCIGLMVAPREFSTTFATMSSI